MNEPVADDPEDWNRLVGARGRDGAARSSRSGRS